MIFVDDEKQPHCFSLLRSPHCDAAARGFKKENPRSGGKTTVQAFQKENVRSDGTTAEAKGCARLLKRVGSLRWSDETKAARGSSSSLRLSEPNGLFTQERSD